MFQPSDVESVNPSDYGITAAELAQLKQRSTDAKSRAYCPYSHFRVGAVLLTTNSTAPYISGANVENASYPVGICAERCALGTAVATFGVQRGQIRAVAVATDVEGLPTSPCGMCRQGLREFMGNEVGVWMFNGEGKGVVARLGELLPMSFGPDALPAPKDLPPYQGPS